MKSNQISLFIMVFVLAGCMAPPPKKSRPIAEKHNYIILLDLSDRLIVQPDQSERDKEIIRSIYTLFENRIRQGLYIKSRDEIKVVIAPQSGSGLRTDIYEESLYYNMENIPFDRRRPEEDQRRESFNKALDELYEKAVFSNVPEDYYGADIWKYFYEDLSGDCSYDTLTTNYLFILSDGYPIVGRDLAKLQPVKDHFADLQVILMEASPRDKDMEWDRIMEMWEQWFKGMGIDHYTFIKRKAISKEIEQVKEITSAK